MPFAMVDHTRNPIWGQTLRAKVAESGLSQRAFAERHGFVSRTFNSWCNGRWPGEKQAREVAKALGIDYAALVSDRRGSFASSAMQSCSVVILGFSWFFGSIAQRRNPTTGIFLTQ